MTGLRIPMYRPLIQEEELEAAREALEMGWLGMGSYVSDFESAIRSYLGSGDRYVAVLSTGHAALHVGLLLAGVGPGDEVLTPAFNNVADFQAILNTGAEPVLCDIRDDTLCIDIAKAEALVSSRTRAMIVMDYGCALCDHDGVETFARAHGLRVVHDAAHSFGSKYRGKMIGSFSDICMFSFDPVKSITCIEGGALVVRSPEELEAVHETRLIGMGQPAEIMYQNRRAWTYDVKRLGFRYHMPNLHAAIGLAQLRKIGAITESRRSAARYLREHLLDVPGVRTPPADFWDITPFLFYVRVPDTRRRAFREHLAEHGVETGVHWQPAHWFTLFRNCRRGDLSVTERASREIVSLPLHSCMSRDSLDAILAAIRSFPG